MDLINYHQIFLIKLHNLLMEMLQPYQINLNINLILQQNLFIKILLVKYLFQIFQTFLQFFIIDKL